MRFVIGNMNCGGCAKGVTAIVKNTDPSAQIEVQLDKKEIDVSGGYADCEALRNALQSAGWQAAPVTA